jgi:hypothetical protein
VAGRIKLICMQRLKYFVTCFSSTWHYKIFHFPVLFKKQLWIIPSYVEHGVILRVSSPMTKRKCKQRWSTIPPILTKLPHLSSNHWTQKKTRTYGIVIAGPQIQKLSVGKGWVNQLTLSDNWISNDNTDINKQNITDSRLS